MTENECLSKMISPGTKRPSAYRGGIIQIHVTRACNFHCFNCTQGSQLAGHTEAMTPDLFEKALLSLKKWWGVVGVFGGNPAVSKHFESYCRLLQKHIPFEQRGLWCNNPLKHGKLMRQTFNPAVSNLNVHLDREAYLRFKKDWPECSPVGLEKDSRHSPPYVAMKDLLLTTCDDCSGNTGFFDRANGERHLSDPEDGTKWSKCQTCAGTGKVPDESRIYDLISTCDINHYWSSMIGVFRGQLRAWFCEIAGAQAMLHQHEEDYPDTGLPLQKWHVGNGEQEWWELPMKLYADQVKKHCFDCGVPLRGHGELAMAGDEGVEQVSATHEAVYKPKKPNRRVELVTVDTQLGKLLPRMTDYLKNS